MSSAGAIKAGSAYVELGIDSKSLDAGLKAAASKMREFGSKDLEVGLKAAASKMRDFGGGLTTIGKAFTGMGAAIAAPLSLAAHSFAEYGETIGNLSIKTGIAEEALAGLAYAAQRSNVSTGSLANSVKKMQVSISKGSAETVSSLAGLGLSLNSLKGMDVEARFEAVADGLSNMSDESAKTRIATSLLGRSAIDLFPVFDEGSAGIKKLIGEARQLGLVLGPEQSSRARALNEGFERLSAGIKGVALSVGGALAPTVQSSVTTLVEMIVAVRKWIELNPETIQGLEKVALTLLSVGVGFLIVGATVSALMSPVVMITAAIIGIGMAALAITDGLGITATGFGDLFNSIRVDGTGLGTWFTGFWLFISKGFSYLKTGVVYIGLAIWDGIQWVGIKMESMFASAFGLILKGVRAVINAYNSIAPSALSIDTSGLNAAIMGTQQIQRLGQQDIDKAAERRQRVLTDGDNERAMLDKKMQDNFLADPQDNSKGVTVDTSKAKDALQKIGGNIWDTIEGAAKSVVSKFDVPSVDFGELSTKKSSGSSGSDGSFASMKGNVLGTFNSSSVSQLGVGSSVGERMAKSLNKIEQNTDPRNQTAGRAV
jgi:hypothetical protein